MPSIQLAPESFVSRIVRDPANPPATLLLRGFLGEAPDPEQIRVYLDVELSRFVDAPRQAVLHVQPIPAEHNLLGGQMIWLQREAPMNRGQVAGGAEAFLAGDNHGFPRPEPRPEQSASRRPAESFSCACPPETEDASCATAFQQTTCVPQTQAPACYAPEVPRESALFGRASTPMVTPMVSAETAERCRH